MCNFVFIAELPIDTFVTEVIPWAHSEDASEGVAALLDKYLTAEAGHLKHAADQFGEGDCSYQLPQRRGEEEGWC